VNIELTVLFGRGEVLTLLDLHKAARIEAR